MEHKNRQNRIMAILIDNPRRSLTEMSKETGWPISTVYNAIKAIEKKYIFKGFFVERSSQ